MILEVPVTIPVVQFVHVKARVFLIQMLHTTSNLGLIKDKSVFLSQLYAYVILIYSTFGMPFHIICH